MSKDDITRIGKHWITPEPSVTKTFGWKKDTSWRAPSASHHLEPYTDGPDLLPPRPLVPPWWYQKTWSNGDYPLFVNQSDLVWLHTVWATERAPVVHDPAPPPTLDELAITG